MAEHNIFGEEIKPAFKKGLSIKDKFRRLHGYLEGGLCRNCKYFQKFSYHDRNYYKCLLMGLSNSEATDIHLKDTACNAYKRREP